MKQLIWVCLLVFCVSSGVFAAVTSFTNRTDFNAEGVIMYNYDFEDQAVDGSGFGYPPNPWTRDGITYTTTENLIVSPTTGYRPQSKVFIYNYWTPLTGTIDTTPQFSMFGFDLGVLGHDSLLNVEISTNLDTYSFSNLNVPNVNQGMNFYGFTTSAGEYFTAFNMISQYGSGSAPAIDNPTLGHTQISAVPVPSSILLAGIGIIGVRKLLRKK